MPVETEEDTYVYLLSFVTLGSWTLALWHIAFVRIDQVLPAYAEISTNSETYIFMYGKLLGSVVNSMARLIVSYSIYLWAMIKLNRRLSHRPGQRYSDARQLFISLTVLVAGAIGIITFIVLLTALVKGNLASRSMSKIAVVLAVEGGILMYCPRWLGGYSLWANRIFMAVSLVATAAGVTTGLWILGE